MPYYVNCFEKFVLKEPYISYWSTLLNFLFLRSHLGLCTATLSRRRWFGLTQVSDFPMGSQCYTPLTADLGPLLWRRLPQNPSGPTKSKAREKSEIGNFGESCQVLWMYFKYCKIDQNFGIVKIWFEFCIEYAIWNRVHIQTWVF